MLELLYFDGCPSAASLLPHLRTLLGDDSVELRRVDSPEQAVEARFLGSPSVRVDGVDVEPGAEARRDFGMKCRLYGPAGRLPRDEWIVAAVERAKRARA